MGAFAIIRRDKRRQRKEVENKLRAAFKAQGFAEPRVFETEFALILLYPKLGSGQINAVTRDSGDFAFYTGTLVHHGKTGTAALQQLLINSPERHLISADLNGSFALVLNNRRGLRLMIDPVGTYKVYTDDKNIVWSNSFLAALATIEKPAINSQGVYEYVFNGATYSRGTVIRQISTVDAGLSRIGRVASFQAHSPQALPEPECATQNLLVEKNISLLRQRIGSYTKAFNGHIDMALTGDHSARLMLALIREAGVTPRLHVYGDNEDAVVKIAKIIAKGEGLPLIHSNKKIPEKNISPDELTEIIQEQFQRFDGCPPDGIFGNGAEPATRRAGASEGRLLLNGGGSKIYRNFFTLPNRSFTPRELLWSFWRRFDIATCSRQFREGPYLAALENSLREALPTSSRLLTRPEIDYIYPAFEGRFRESLNTRLDLRSSDAADLFLDPEIIRAAATIPTRFKSSGQFETALIAAIDPKFMTYPVAPSQPFDFLSPPCPRFTEWLLTRRPLLIRRFDFTWRHRFTKPLIPWYQGIRCVKAALPQGLTYMPYYFRPYRLHNVTQLNRLLTLEYLFQAVGASQPT